jgi:small conductance mechanosensitive channel
MRLRRRREGDGRDPPDRPAPLPALRLPRALRRTEEMREETRAAARQARREVPILLVLFAAVLYLYEHRDELGGEFETPVQVITVVALVILGWRLARDVGRAFGPQLLGRLDPATAGTVGFLIRLVFIGVAVLLALRVAGLSPRTLAVGGAFTAVIVGLAAQQTLGNLIAGTVLLSAQPFRVGDRIRLQAGGVAGQLEGTVTTLGLLYTTLQQGADDILVPNSVVLSAAITPLREPAAVSFLARLRPGVRPSDVQRLLEATVTVATRTPPHIDLEEIDDDEVVVRVTATPIDEDEGWLLADQILAAVEQVTRGEVTMEHQVVAPAPERSPRSRADAS